MEKCKELYREMKKVYIVLRPKKATKCYIAGKVSGEDAFSVYEKFSYAEEMVNEH